MTSHPQPTHEASASPAPRLSVVVVVGQQRARAGPCLRSILDQELPGAGDTLEILLVDCAEDELAAIPVPHAGDPRVRRLRVDPSTTFARSRGHGLRRARAPHVAFIEEHCRAEPGWAKALLAALEEGWSGIAYGFLNGNPGVGLSDFCGATSYAAFNLPTARRTARMLSGHNAAFRRDALLALGERLEELLECDLVIHEMLARAGHRLLIEPAAVVRHLNETTLRSRARGIFLFHRIYAALRAREERWPWWRRAVYVLATPLLPLYSFPIHLRQTRDPARRRLLWRSLPAYTILGWTHGCGQTLGLLAGVGDAPLRFTHFENAEPRPER